MKKLKNLMVLLFTKNKCSYYVFPADQSEFIFCLVDRPESPAVKIAIAAAAVLLIILFFVVIRLRKKKMS